MKVLTIIDPYASAIASGMKHYETRSWATSYRGRIAIHVGKSKMYTKNKELMALVGVDDIPYGKIICTADLVDCIEMTDDFINSLPEHERKLGFYSVGRYAWKLENVQLIDPIEAQGHQRIWEYKENLA